MAHTRTDAQTLAGCIDHTLLRADAVARDIETLCAEARRWGFFGTCVHSGWVGLARGLLSGTAVRVVSVAGFPLGASCTAAKCAETVLALDAGADEIDVVLNIGRLKQGDDCYVAREIADIVRASGGHTVKVILETGLLSRGEKIRACRLAVDGGAGFVKTSTGFGPGGATVADVALLRACTGPAAGVKASGGIRDAATALALIEAGASRLGTSSGAAIVQGAAIVHGAARGRGRPARP